MKTLLLALSGLLGSLFFGSCSSAPAAGAAPIEAGRIESFEVAYEANGTELTGFLARPSDRSKSAPGVLVVHEWWGHNDYVRTRATQLAELGYVAFALDMYGTGKTASHPADATEFMKEVMGNAELMEARFLAGLEVLNEQEGVNRKKTGVIGYCMGGGIALKMARETGAVDAVASFHGSLGAALGAKDAGGLSHVLIATGGDDIWVPAALVSETELEFNDIPGVKSVQVETYDGALHGFTNPAATALGNELELPLRYDAEADAASWEALKSMFATAL